MPIAENAASQPFAKERPAASVNPSGRACMIAERSASAILRSASR